MPAKNTRNYSSESGFGHLILLLVLVIVALLIAGVAWRISATRSSLPEGNGNATYVLGKKAPAIACSKVQQLIKQAPDGDLCYTANFKVDGENIKYIIVNQSSDYQAKQKSACTLDCGGTIPITRSDYIVRASGTVQLADTDWAVPAEPQLDDITGCGQDKYFNLKSSDATSEFGLDNGNVVLNVAFKNLRLPDNYDDNCLVSGKLTYNYGAKDNQVAVKALAVHYELQPLAHCQQQSSARSQAACYGSQATMRNDLSVCNQSIDPTDSADGAEACISGIAKRRQDPSICNTIQSDWRATCITDTTNLRETFSGKLVVQ